MWGDDFTINFAAHCDEAGLSFEQGVNLAQELGDTLLAYAEDRRWQPGVTIEEDLSE